MAGRITLTDVARHAGVSPATASLVLRGTGRVGAETRARVRASMQELGYIYHRGAASLRASRSQTIGVIVSDIANIFTAELTIGLEATLAHEHVVTLTASSLEDPDRQALLVQAMLERQVDGLMVIPVVDSTPAFIESLARLPIPVVLASREPADHNLTYVGIDNLRGGRLAAEHLLTHGVGSVGYLGGYAEMGPRHDRLAGVRDVLAHPPRAARVAVDLVGPPTGTWGLATMQALLAEPTTVPDALVCQNDEVAFGVFRALREFERTHATVPVVRVVSFDDVTEAALWEPPLTSVAAGGKEVGIRCAEILHRRIERPDAPAERSLIVPSITIRESCGCRPQR